MGGLSGWLVGWLVGWLDGYIGIYIDIWIQGYGVTGIHRYRDTGIYARINSLQWTSDVLKTR